MACSSKLCAGRRGKNGRNEIMLTVSPRFLLTHDDHLLHNDSDSVSWRSGDRLQLGVNDFLRRNPHHTSKLKKRDTRSEIACRNDTVGGAGNKREMVSRGRRFQKAHTLRIAHTEVLPTPEVIRYLPSGVNWLPIDPFPELPKPETFTAW